MVAGQELEQRIHAVRAALGNQWDTLLVTDKINQYYLCGTLQDGLLVIRNNGGVYYFTRRGFERAKLECPLPVVYPMRSYRDAAAVIGGNLGVTYLETEIIPLAMAARLEKHFIMEEVRSADALIASVRSVKSAYERDCTRQAGRLHNDFLTNVVPALLQEGVSEAEFTGEVYRAMLRHGHQGVIRFGMFQTEMPLGQMGFGENSLYPTCFDGPGGMRGMGPASPAIGGRERLLQKGDLVFLDFAYGVEGYHTDKTQVYMFGAAPSEEVAAAHKKCMEIQKEAAALLKPGNLPSQIYADIIGGLDKAFLENFMGFGGRRAGFLGHGVGLRVDETPVIAKGFDAPLRENTVIALEPKKGMAGAGMVGVEDTYLVTPDGGECLTGGGSEIIVV
ncbi:MAG: Xaa-Pro peptidase family protein [Clostridiales bacterium]|jgi:Xaa-Pro aminopeptidase|nr:Xaa-Pro peptidase family protein [Clostridiales bacterium]